MSITLDQARGIVRGVAPQQSGDDWENLFGGDGGTSGPQPYTFPPQPLPPGEAGPPAPGQTLPPGSLYRDPNSGLWQYWNGTSFQLAPQWVQQAGGAVPGSGGSGMQVKQIGDKIYVFDPNTGQFVDSGLSDPSGSGNFDTGPGYLDLANRQFGFESGPQFQEGIRQFNQQFGLNQTVANRNELGQRAGAGLSTGNLALDLALRNDRLANDPGNFPAWLQAMQNNTAPGPSVQNLVGQGVTIEPAPNDWLNSPQFQSLMESLFDYGTVPDAGAVGQVQQAYNTDPKAAQTFFSQKPEDLKRMFGTPLATGGQLTTQGPMTFKDLSTGKNVATAGEAGPEQITVTPLTGNPTMQTAQTNPVGQSWIDAWRAYHPGEADPVPGYGNQVSPSQGTAMALGKVLGAGGFSFFPPDVRQKLLRGELMAPGELPDWILNKLPPSIRQLMAALITSRLGGPGAEDFDWTRGLYEAKGFGPGTGGIVR